MTYATASRIARQRCAGQQRGAVSCGQIVTWEDTRVRYTFTPNHAYTTEGTLVKTDLATGRKSVVSR